MDKRHIQPSSDLIRRIDSGEVDVFLDAIHTDRSIVDEAFLDDAGAVVGVVFACLFADQLRIHIAFARDTADHNDRICDLVRAALRETGRGGSIWIRNENRRIIDALQRELPLQRAGDRYDYASIEFIMRRDAFQRRWYPGPLAAKPYQPEHIDDYLALLDGAMAFEDPAPAYRAHREHYAQRLSRMGDAFEAFWVGDALVGLYWREGAEIDHMAVAEGQQRRGYGTAILTRAIEQAFAHTDASFARLYAVDWNEKGQRFYRKYGMEASGHSYMLHMAQCMV